MLLKIVSGSQTDAGIQGVDIQGSATGLQVHIDKRGRVGILGEDGIWMHAGPVYRAQKVPGNIDHLAERS